MNKDVDEVNEINPPTEQCRESTQLSSKVKTKSSIDKKEIRMRVEIEGKE